MSAPSPRSVGREVLGPVVAEFCQRVWTLTTQLRDPDRATLLYCARGGLRLLTAQQRFAAATGLSTPVPAAPFMVSRLVAARAALATTVGAAAEAGPRALAPSLVTALGHEFGQATVGEVAGWLSGVPPREPGRWGANYTPEGLVALLGHPDGAGVVEAVRAQAGLFGRHVRELVGERDRVLLVDTGLYGTTGDLLTDGFPDLDVSSLLLARSYRAMTPGRSARAIGLSVQAREYDPTRHRTAVLRHWHWVEQVFEPALPSARDFTEVAGRVVSDVQVDRWADRVEPEPGSVFAGVLEHLDSLTPGSALTRQRDARVAWGRLHRAVVLPTPDLGRALRVSTRTHDFGRTEAWTDGDRRPLEALRGPATWREGEIARSASRVRLPLLLAVEAAYAARVLYRRGRAAGRGRAGDAER